MYFVNKRFFFSFLFFSVLVFSIISCKKINETANVGGLIIPGVDGVTTFDTVLNVDTYNGLFNALNDSVAIDQSEDHILGNIFNDPLFGKTNAKIFLELKPISYKWTFSNITNKDSLFLDSVVLVLGCHSIYGDTTTFQRVRVYEMDQSNYFKYDSAYQIRQQYFTYSNLLGSKDFFPYTLNDSVKAFKDTTANQLRIRLNDNFGRRLLDYDTTNAYNSDSAFKAYIKGFAIEADQSIGNALMGFGLASEKNTKLAIYYRFNKNGKQDTTVNYFQFYGASAHHNYINRNITGTPYESSQGGITPDNLIYLQNAPGSYATIKIPGLKNLSNRIIHRAELIVEQVYDPFDAVFTPSEALYLDLYDSTISSYKAVPYDYVNDNTGENQIHFGMFGKFETDASGNKIKVWKFNITRYVQNILTKNEPLHNFRILSHHLLSENYKLNNANNAGSYVTISIPISSSLGLGRVRVGGGNHPTQQMRLRLVYSKI